MNGRSYCVIPYETSATWENAEATCQMIGGHLATIETDEAFREVVTDWLPSSSLDNERELWIGLNDRLVEGNGTNYANDFTNKLDSFFSFIPSTNIGKSYRAVNMTTIIDKFE